MADNIQVRLVNVEFLRPGPPQNELLSPLTQYLAVCGDAGAGVLHFNYRTRYNDAWARPDLQNKHGYTTSYRKDDQASTIVALLPAGGGA
jgi:hypothetical protein